MLPLLVLLFVLVPIAELAIIVQVGQAIGLWWTIALLVADSVVGSLLMRAQGRAAWRRFDDALRSGRVPAKEVIDGGLVIFGGACLLTPGFMTDLFGLALLVPPTRAVLRRLLVRRFAGRMLSSVVRGPIGRRPGTGAGAGAGDYEGTAHEVDDPRLRP